MTPRNDAVRSWAFCVVVFLFECLVMITPASLRRHSQLSSQTRLMEGVSGRGAGLEV